MARKILEPDVAEEIIVKKQSLANMIRANLLSSI